MTIEKGTEKMVYGRALLGKLHHVKNTRGRKGLDDIFKKMIEEGYRGPSHMGEIEQNKAYPFEYHLLLLDSFYNLYGKSEFDRMSKKAPMMKSVVGWYIKFFKKPGVMMEKVGDYWGKFFDFGELEGRLVNKNQGSLTGRGICTDTHLFCRSLTGYFVGVCNLIELNTVCKHTSCELEGKKSSEWKLHW